MESRPLPTGLVVAHGDASLICRLPTLDDIPAIVDACQDPEIPRWTTVPSDYTEANGRSFVEHAAAQWGTRSGLVTVIIPSDAHQLAHLPLLGALDSRINWAAEEAVVGYWCHTDARGHGVSSTALARMCHWLFELGMQRIEAVVLVGNVGSDKTLRKVGFRLEGTIRSRGAGRCGVDLDRIDEWIFGLLPEDFTGLLT